MDKWESAVRHIWDLTSDLDADISRVELMDLLRAIEQSCKEAIEDKPHEHDHRTAD